MTEQTFQQSLFAELHNRPFPMLNSPASLSQMIRLAPGDPVAELQHIAALAARYSAAMPEAGATCYYQRLGEFEFRWERHTEFSSYIVILPRTESTPFSLPAVQVLPADWLASLSGSMIGGDHIELRPAPAQQPESAVLHQHFEGHRLIGSRVLDNEATLWTALREHSDGFCRTLIFMANEDPCEGGRLVRSLLELFAYRNLTLLALPLARDLIPEVSRMELELATLTERLTAIGSFADEKVLLEQLSELAAQLEGKLSENTFRFAATEAYYQLTEDRLREIREQPLENLRTLQQFHYRRFRPGFSTCQSVRSRLNELSLRVNRSSGLLRTRVDLMLESQNQNLLRSMDRRAKLQLRMQQTVEGLSIIAMTHYALSLLGHILAGIPEHALPLAKEAIVACATPVTFAAAWLSVRRIRRQFQQADSRADNPRFRS